MLTVDKLNPGRPNRSRPGQGRPEHRQLKQPNPGKLASPGSCVLALILLYTVPPPGLAQSIAAEPSAQASPARMEEVGTEDVNLTTPQPSAQAAPARVEEAGTENVNLTTPQPSAQASPARVEEVTVIGRRSFLETVFTAQRTGAGVDTAGFMNQVPGGATASNGPLTGQLQYRGMFGPRLNVRVDGMLIHGGGPNWMAPPLHHIPAGLLEELVVEQGIASIATGGGIGGAATARWKKPAYGNSADWRWTGDTELGLESVNAGVSAAGVVGLSKHNQRLYVVGSFDAADDYEVAEGRASHHSAASGNTGDTSNTGGTGNTGGTSNTGGTGNTGTTNPSPGTDTAVATQYQRDVYGLGYTAEFGLSELELNWHRLETDHTGTPSLPMDIDWFDTEVWNLGYHTSIGGVDLSARIYGATIDHGMNNYLLRSPPDFSSLNLPPFAGDDRRQVRTDSTELGFKLTLAWPLSRGQLQTGLEGKDAVHNATVYDPDFAPFFVQNFNDVAVQNRSWFAQWSALLSPHWYVEAGLRLERVAMTARPVAAFPAQLVDSNPARWGPGTPPRAVWLLREHFNQADRSQHDHNHDWVVKSRHQLSAAVVLELAAARKTRAPLYQERYLWLPLEVNAGLGDGNNYMGNLQLTAEVSQQLELGLDFDYGDLSFSPRLHWRKVDDYIQGVAVARTAGATEGPPEGTAAAAISSAVVGVSRNANGDPTPLVFANTAAELMGLELAVAYQLSDAWRLAGIASYVRGKRGDVDDNLYRVAPTRARLSLAYSRGNWRGELEQVLVARQTRLSATNTDDPTNGNNSYEPSRGYALTNLHVNWQLDRDFSVALGAENIFDRHYVDHTSGFNRVPNSAVPRGSRMIGPGRNVYGRLQYRW